MSPVFIDASYLLGLELKDDQNHEAAVAHWRRVAIACPAMVTTSYVFDEVVTFLNTRGHHRKATQVGNALLSSPSLRLVHVDQTLFETAWDYFQQHADKTYSFTDCVSFVVLRNFGIATAFAFDRHFVQAGFTTEP
jgi:predicted nucleic acid-binding protein